MKFSGLFRKKENAEVPEVSELCSIQDSLGKLWRMAHQDVFTADKAREIADDKYSFIYLDENVIAKILEAVRREAQRHYRMVDGGIGGLTLSSDEINYCVKYLERAGYLNVRILNNDVPSVYPKSVEYHLEW